MFLSFQLFEKCFEQPRMTGWCDKALLAHLVDALDKRTGQTELDKLGPDLLPFLMIRGNGATLVDQGLDAGARQRRKICGVQIAVCVVKP